MGRVLGVYYRASIPKIPGPGVHLTTYYTTEIFECYTAGCARFVPDKTCGTVVVLTDNDILANLTGTIILGGNLKANGVSTD